MSLQEHNFTYEQLKSIYTFLEWVNNCNNELGSNCNVEALQLYKDNYGNFYASYFMNSFNQNGLVSSLEYIEINREGEKTNLTGRYTNTADIATKLSRYEEIKLM